MTLDSSALPVRLNPCNEIETRWSFKREKGMARIGVDLGGTKIELILTEDNPLEVRERIRVPTEKAHGYEHLLNQLVGLLEGLRAQSPDPVRIGLRIPGAVDRQGQVVTSNIRCLDNVFLARDLSERLDQEVQVGNDANCFTLSEALHGAAKGLRMVFGVILGTGVGGGLVLDGESWSGLHGIAGEFGHVSINYQGVPCYCGRRGCMEQYLAGPSIQRAYEQRSGKKSEVQAIAEAAQTKEDPHAVAVMEEFLEVYAQAMANVIAELDPDAIVLGGGVSNLDLLYTEGQARIQQIALPGARKTQILKNQLGDSSGVYGAAALG